LTTFWIRSPRTVVGGVCACASVDARRQGGAGEEAEGEAEAEAGSAARASSRGVHRQAVRRRMVSSTSAPESFFAE
jgi:hypothetical protein